MIKINTERAANISRQLYKKERAQAVSAIVVTTASGRIFDGDEQSQERMSRSLTALEEGELITWVMADNTVSQVTREELREALRLAGARQAELWVAKE